MAKIEGWEPHPTRKIIYKDLKTGLLYRRRESGSFDMVPSENDRTSGTGNIQKSRWGVVAMTSRSRGRTPPSSDKTLAKESD